MCGCWIGRLLYLGILLSVAVALQIRYSLSPHGLIATSKGNKAIVANKSECMLHAFRENKIAFSVETVADGMRCVVLDGLVGFEQGSEKIETYLLDNSTQNDNQCMDPSKIDVRKFVAFEKCELEPEMCDKLRKLSEHCKTKADIPSCIVAPTCPQGQKSINGAKECCYAIKQKDGKEVCCPKNTFPGKSADGDELCCPQRATCCPGGTVVSGTHEGRVTCCSKGQTFQKVLNGKDLCCPSGQAVLDGSSSCCWAIKDKGRDVCCPKNTFPGKYGGKEVCCPEKDTCCAPGYEVGGADGNKAVCCLNGQKKVNGAKKCCYVMKQKDGKEVCCPKNTFPGKGENGDELCCPQKGTCCPGGTVVSDIFEGRATCCPKGQKFIKVRNGADWCCPAERAINFKGKRSCCEEYYPAKHGSDEVCCPVKGSCCPEDQEVGGLHGQWAVCCPKGEYLADVLDGIVYCCPKGKIISKIHYGEYACCPNGTEFKGMQNQRPVCCPKSMTRAEGTAICCPQGFTYYWGFRKCLAFVPLDNIPVQNQTQINDHCKRYHGEPVKIENNEQNGIIQRLSPTAVIGLQIPEGKAWSKGGFRWVSDGSKPSYTNFVPGEPNNLIGISAPAQGPEYFVRLNGLGQWLDVNGTPAWLGLRGILLLVHATDSLRLRYSLTPHELIARKRDVKGVVAGKLQCALTAFQEDKIAFLIEDGQICVLLDGLKGFQEKSGPNRETYLLDTNTQNDRCGDPPKFDVAQLLSQSDDCGKHKILCEKMKELDESISEDSTCCRPSGGDSSNEEKCPVESRGKYSNGTSFCCPDGKIFGETDGLPTCCPRGQNFQKKEDDRDMCCPKDTELKGVFDGKPVCCPSSMAHISGTSQCCPGNCTYKESFQQCLGVVNLSPLPTTQKELNQFCRDEGAEPVKIQNAAQNQDVASMATNPMIGLHIPEGVAWAKDNF
ncbi:hypothetical protein QR680_008157 [Steinernema hermaphroditum]|uniref:C-type lectin domain-containing protein n=1 Tax=Steinernema hermaphroditum TaxID=289476 RepID=A0AA39M7M0_9BILA|nr:hypothetical protein QR680_008157 [Steinernema hermaphroditum]